MPNNTGTDRAIPDEHDAETSANGPDELLSAMEGAQLRVLPVFPMLLGAFVCALSIFAAFRLGPLLWGSRILGTLPTTLLAIGLLIGLFLIVYSFVLRSVEANRQSANLLSANHRLSQDASRYVKWVVVPLILALLAFAATVWAAEIAQPAAPEPAVEKPCSQLYLDALSIQKDSPNFRFPASDPDQQRCFINRVFA